MKPAGTWAYGIALCIGCKNTFRAANDDGACDRNWHGDLHLRVICPRCMKAGCVWFDREAGSLTKEDAIAGV